jgi:hypothetical protein
MTIATYYGSIVSSHRGGEVNEANLSLTLFIGIVVAVVANYVVQGSAGLGSPVQVLTLVGVIYLILKDLLTSIGGGKHAWHP